MMTDTSAKRAMVTGASGFTGRYLCRHLARAGWQVAAIARPASAPGLRTDPSIERVYEYTGHTAELLDACADARPTAVFHLVSLYFTTHTSEQVEPLITTNILFGAQLLEAMKNSGCTVLVNAGSYWQNYRAQPPFDGPEFCPVDLYAATKQAFEALAMFYVETAGLRCINLRLFDSYGAGDTRRKVVRLLLDTLRTGQPLGMSPGDQILDLIHIDDMCRAFLHAAELALEQPRPGAAIYSVSGGQRRSLREVVATLEEAAGRKLPVEFGARPHRYREVMNPWQGPPLPGWSPQIELLEGFRSLIAEEILQAQ